VPLNSLKPVNVITLTTRTKNLRAGLSMKAIMQQYCVRFLLKAPQVCTDIHDAGAGMHRVNGGVCVAKNILHP